MLAHPQEFYHLRLRVTAASFLTPLLMRSHQEATRPVPRVGGFVEPDTMVIATEGTGCPTAPHGQTHAPLTHALICQG